MQKIEGTILLAALCLVCMPVVFGDDCAPYVGSDFALHRGQTCILSFCAGTCTERYCGIIPGTQLDQAQFMCVVNNLYFVVGCGAVVALILIGGVIACCCKSLCVCFGLCCPQRSPHHVTSSMAVTNVVHRQPLVQIPYTTSTTGYMPVAGQTVYAGQYPPPYPGADNKAFEETP
ncbi:protein shisa-5-like isoform X2 [Hyla sarda]|uniref:protein shisa-5-like isoform X2 n=1 Tax=Hyla sarda TaxID=327740 RepID=UPI0024C3AAC9|nr:protein shisa-5-like isoform X2 [Hyla sarda]